MTKRVLIVAPHFAPVNAPDGHRARLILPWLRECGWQPTILAVRPERILAPLEPALMDTIPTDIEIVRANAFDSVRSRRFGVGNLGWRCLPWLAREGSHLLRSERFDLVYFSTTQFACLPLGRSWRRRFGIPYVIDLQDPWHNPYYRQRGGSPPPGGWKYRFAAMSTSLSEGWTLRRCSHVIAVSRRYIDDLKHRRSWFDPSLASVIPFGWSENDQKIAAAMPATVIDAAPTILYIGRVGADMTRLLRKLLAAFAEWRATRPVSPRVTWRFVGTSYAGRTAAAGVPTRLAQELGLADAVVEDPDRIGYLQAIAAQQRSHANLILGSDDASYSPSKLWPTLASGRPWLTCIDDQSTLAELLRPHSSAGLVLGGSGAFLAGEPRDRFYNFLDELARGGVTPRPASPALRDFHADRLAHEHAEIFNRVVNS
ncbi:MAG: glycosyltransferase [Opitutaceae bacterium]|nr:glycosyltransferase [Opitutaceae bacterium]